MVCLYMNWTEKKSIRIAILDMYEGFANQGMRCIRNILNQFGEANHLDLTWDEFKAGYLMPETKNKLNNEPIFADKVDIDWRDQKIVT